LHVGVGRAILNRDLRQFELHVCLLSLPVRLARAD
jgi:hypothetical protein